MFAAVKQLPFPDVQHDNLLCENLTKCLYIDFSINDIIYEDNNEDGGVV